MTPSLHTSAAPPRPTTAATLSQREPASSAGRWVALFQSPPLDPDRTRTENLDGTTGGGTDSGPERLPEPPPGYDLLRPLGSGGWGSVYLAREQAAERTVAVKFLHAPSSMAAFDRFLVEARAQAKLDHPNVVRVFHVETNWREPFLTMEYASAGTLADLAKPGQPLPTPAEAARLILGAAEGVAAAHAAGILHRDIKPSNVLLSGVRSQESGVSQQGSGVGGQGSEGAGSGSSLTPDSCLLTPKVSDFGLAKRTDRDDGLTRTGPLGTPCYMSPEAASGQFREVGPPADVYGLGATLYFLLTGRTPFLADSTEQVLHKVMYDPPERVRAVRPEVPAELEAIVAQAMEKKPARRYPTAAALAADLRRFLEGQRPVAPVQSPRRRAWRWLVRRRAAITVVAAIVLVAAGLVALGLWLAQPGPPPDPLEQIRADLAAGKPVTLIGETGLPKRYEQLLEANGVGTSPQSDGACEFHAFDVCLLELLPDPGINRYRVQFEIRHLPGKDANLQTGNYVGVYFGYSSTAMEDGTVVHGMFAVTWKDRTGPGVDPKNPGVQPVSLARLGFLQHTDRLGLADPAKPAAVRFRPPPRLPGPWRPVVVEVTPDGVHVPHQPWWDDLKGVRKPLVLWSAERSGEEYGKLKASLNDRLAGAGSGLPPWNPRMPFGVVAHKSAVAIRNVVITPLP